MIPMDPLAEPRAGMLGDDAPWQPADLMNALVIGAIGLCGIGASWFGASGKADWPDALPWVAVGVAGAAVSALAVTSWLLGGVRRVGALRRQIVDLLEPRVLAVPRTPGSFVPGSEVVTTDAMTRFHVPTCAMAAGKPVRALSRRVAEQAGLVPCGVCRP
jgi:hypothetical protein